MLEPLASAVEKFEAKLIAQLDQGLQFDCDLILIESLSETGWTPFHSAVVYARTIANQLRLIRQQHNLVRLSKQRGWVTGWVSWWGDDEPKVSWIHPRLPPPEHGRPTVPRLPNGTPCYEAVKQKVQLLRARLDYLETKNLEALLP